MNCFLGLIEDVVHGNVPARASRSVVIFSCLRHCRSIHVISRASLFSCASLHFPRVLLCFLTLLRLYLRVGMPGFVRGGGMGWGGGGVGGDDNVLVY